MWSPTRKDNDVGSNENGCVKWEERRGELQTEGDQEEKEEPLLRGHQPAKQRKPRGASGGLGL